MGLKFKRKKVYKENIEGKGKTGGKNIKWSNTAPTSSGRQSAANVVSGDIDVVNARRSISEPRMRGKFFYTGHAFTHEQKNQKSACRMIAERP